MQLRDLMSLISEAEYLQDWESSGLGNEYGTLQPEKIRNLAPNEFADFLDRVDTLVKGVLQLKETSL